MANAACSPTADYGPPSGTVQPPSAKTRSGVRFQRECRDAAFAQVKLPLPRSTRLLPRPKTSNSVNNDDCPPPYGSE
jgi:hypothetical protein